MQRSILEFRLDSEDDWAAELSCGHRQHTRHDPPRVERPWVLTADGRESRVGTTLDCGRCDKSEMPAAYVAYKSTPVFTQTSVPKGLLGTHTTKRGIWALIHVTEGALEYVKDAPFDSREILTAASPGVVLPEVKHHVACIGDVTFSVEFWRRA
jgi:tellurite methyltransferase